MLPSNQKKYNSICEQFDISQISNTLRKILRSQPGGNQNHNVRKIKRKNLTEVKKKTLHRKSGVIQIFHTVNILSTKSNKLSYRWFQLYQIEPMVQQLLLKQQPLAIFVFQLITFLSFFYRFLFSGLQNVDIAYIPIHCTTGSRVDPYTTENLSTLRGSYKPLADPVILTKVNFTSFEVSVCLSFNMGDYIHY